MYDDKTIIISCAGMGKRLGLGIPKALIEIEGKPLIIRHLEMLKDCSDVRIVVGYKAEEVIKTVTKYRRDITFVFNHDYMNNGTGASVTLASKFANKYVITIDGDLLIHPDDMKKILDHPTSFIGVCKASTDNPVLTEIKNNKVVEFSREHGSFEWTGVSQFESAKIQGGNGHVYQLLEPSLPTDYIFLRTKEIDTPNDHEHAIKWVKNNFSDNITIGVLGGMGTVATANFFDRLINAFPAEKEVKISQFGMIIDPSDEILGYKIDAYYAVQANGMLLGYLAENNMITDDKFSVIAKIVPENKAVVSTSVIDEKLMPVIGYTGKNYIAVGFNGNMLGYAQYDGQVLDFQKNK